MKWKPQNLLQHYQHIVQYLAIKENIHIKELNLKEICQMNYVEQMSENVL